MGHIRRWVADDMHRRDFLLLRTERSQRVAHLSCERLYMHYQHTTLTMPTEPTTEPSDEPPSVFLELGNDEPPAVFTPRSTDQLFEDISRDLEGADILRVADTSWLAVDTDGFGREVRTLFDGFRNGGGTIEFGDGQSPREA